MEELEKSEREARRLDAALNRGRVSTATEEGSEATEENPASALPPHPGPNPARRRSRTPGSGLLNAISYTLHGMMDVDPETARRNGISKTRESISLVRQIIFPSMHRYNSYQARRCTTFSSPRSEIRVVHDTGRLG